MREEKRVRHRIAHSRIRVNFYKFVPSYWNEKMAANATILRYRTIDTLEHDGDFGGCWSVVASLIVGVLAAIFDHTDNVGRTALPCSLTVLIFEDVIHRLVDVSKRVDVTKKMVQSAHQCPVVKRVHANARSDFSGLFGIDEVQLCVPRIRRVRGSNWAGISVHLTVQTETIRPSVGRGYDAGPH